MRKEERFPAYLEVLWHMVAFTLRAKFHAGKKDPSVHLVYEFDRTRNGAALVESVTSEVGKKKTTITAKLAVRPSANQCSLLDLCTITASLQQIWSFGSVVEGPTPMLCRNIRRDS